MRIAQYLLMIVFFMKTLYSTLACSDMDWLLYKRNFGKTYASEEHDLFRKYIFRENLKWIRKHNKKSRTYTVGVNNFTDFTNEEYRSLFRYKNNTRRLSIVSPAMTIRAFQDGKDEVDWRTKNVVNPVKNQGQCGSCWAFSAVSSIESAYAIAKGKLYSLSEQQVVDCSAKDNGCSGGLMDDAFQYAIDNGMCKENDYPYVAKDGSCTKCDPVVHISGFQDVQPGNETALKMAVAQQPVSIAVEAVQLRQT